MRTQMKRNYHYVESPIRTETARADHCIKCKTPEENHYKQKGFLWIPVRIRVRIDPPHPVVCRKRRLNGGGLSDETGKAEAPCHSRCGTIKIPP
jgi:hypothetical protein